MSAPKERPSDADIELEYYETFFFEKGLEPYPVQEEATTRIFSGDSVLVTVPTGTGKTLMAKAAMLRALRSQKTAIYTTPLRALTEEKYRELCEDFGSDNVGFATGDFKVNPKGAIQVVVAEILWNRIYGDQSRAPADIVIMDEGHYFNDPERGYVWEQSIVGLKPSVQLVILSATIGKPEHFCQWVYVTRGVPMRLVRSDERKVPLVHEFREQYLVELTKELYQNKEYPALIFSFGRAQCFEWARLLRSCPRFVTPEERKEVELRADAALLGEGIAPELRKIFVHGIGVHHAGLLPAYRRLVEELTADRLLKFVVTTETIAAGINLPAKRVVFPSLRKFIGKKPRLLLPAEYHQMAGRAGRPQFDTEGLAITLAPESVVQDFRKEIKNSARGGASVDEARIKKKYYQRAKTDARAKEDVTWDPEAHRQLHEGAPAALSSRTRITAGQILAIGLPDLEAQALPGRAILDREAEEEAAASLPPVDGASASSKADRAPLSAPSALEGHASKAAHPGPDEVPVTSPAPTRASSDSEVDEGGDRLLIDAVIDRLLLPEPDRQNAHKRLAQITANLQALGVLDGHGRQVRGQMIGDIRGADGVFVYYCLTEHDPEYELTRELVEFLVDHHSIQRIFDKKADAKRREWIKQRLGERRRDNPQVTWDDCEAEYWEAHPKEPSAIEQIYQAFLGKLPYPDLHLGRRHKQIWTEMELGEMGFFDYVDEHELAKEEGSLFTYLARIMKTARTLWEATELTHFKVLEDRVREILGAVDERILGS